MGRTYTIEWKDGLARCSSHAPEDVKMAVDAGLLDQKHGRPKTRRTTRKTDRSKLPRKERRTTAD
jgi:hypothetical protein